MNKKANIDATVHRRYIDATWGSICLDCFLTIARADDEAGLKHQELGHICTPLQFLQETDSPRPTQALRYFRQGLPEGIHANVGRIPGTAAEFDFVTLAELQALEETLREILKNY